MKSIFIVLITLLSFTSLFAQNCDCSKFRTGSFEIANQDGTVSKIKRTETKQTETNENVKLKDKVVWVDNCTYKLIPISIQDKTQTVGPDILVFTFIETMEHAYIVHVLIEGKDFEIDAKVYEKGYLNYDK